MRKTLCMGLRGCRFESQFRQLPSLPFSLVSGVTSSSDENGGGGGQKTEVLPANGIFKLKDPTAVGNIA